MWKLLQDLKDTLTKRDFKVILFSDLASHMEYRATVQSEHMDIIIAGYKMLAEGIASAYDPVYRKFLGDGHFFLYEHADGAVQFGLKLIEEWDDLFKEQGKFHMFSSIPIRVGCHFGKVSHLADQEYVGQSIDISRRVQEAAVPNSVLVSQTVMDQLNTGVYEVESVGRKKLKGDVLEERDLYLVKRFRAEEFDKKPSNSLTFYDWFLKGVRLIGTEQEMSDEAIKCYSEALRLNPKYSRAHVNLGIIQTKRGAYREAEDQFAKAIALKPEFSEAHTGLAELNAKMGKKKEAEEEFKLALKYAPDSSEVYNNFGVFLEGEGKFTEAQDNFRKAIEKDKSNHQALNNLASRLMLKGEKLEAARLYREAVTLAPDFAEAHCNYGVLLRESDRSVEAEEHFKEALKLRPDYGDAHRNYAILLQETGKMRSAEQHYFEAIQINPKDADAHFAYGVLLRKMSRNEEAERQFNEVKKLNPALYKQRLEQF